MKRILDILSGDHKLRDLIKQVAEREPMEILSSIGDTDQPFTIAFAKSLSMIVTFAVKGILKNDDYKTIRRSLTHDSISRLASFVAWRITLLEMRANAQCVDGDKYRQLMLRFAEISNLMFP